MTHQWHETEIHDFQAFHCDKCDYRVVAYPHPELGDGGSAHFPEEKMILVGKEKITAEEAEKVAAVWGVKCKVG